MPQRFLKPGIVSSKRWESLTWIAQSFYIRVITLVDDFGRYLADSVLLKNQCFPLREDIRASQVLDLCRDLAGAQLAIFYKVDGKEFLQLTNWTERKRSDASHYPPHTNPKAVLMFPQPSAAIRSEPQPPSLSLSLESKPSSESKSKPLGGGKPDISKRIDSDYAREQGVRPNAPTLQEALNHFEGVRTMAPECDYTDDEVKAAWLSMEASKDVDGNWYWGKRICGDWKAALETRIGDARDRKPTKGQTSQPKGPSLLDKEIERLSR